MTEPLGYVPEKKSLVLSLGADFAQIIKPPTGDTFPAATTAKIEFYNQAGTILDSWEAAVTTAKAEWREEAVVADAIPNRTPYRLYISFPGSPRLDFCRYYGTVQRKQ